MKVQDIHARSLATAIMIYGRFVEDFVKPIEVVRVLNEAKVPFVLVGTYGLSGWMEKTRATEVVDVIVATRSHKKAVRALEVVEPAAASDRGRPASSAPHDGVAGGPGR
jgi:hypothetical protein